LHASRPLGPTNPNFYKSWLWAQSDHRKIQYSVLSSTLNTTTYQYIENIALRSDMTSHLLGSSLWQWLHQWPHFLHS